MTDPISPVSVPEQYSPSLLPRDTIRTVIALVLYALFVWRLHLTRRTVAAEKRAVAV